MAFDLQKLLEMAPFLMGAFRGPSPEGNAMLEGYVKGQAGKRTLADREREQKRQALLDSLAQQNTATDNARADAAMRFNQEGRQRDDARADDAAGLNRFETFQRTGLSRATQLADLPGTDATTGQAALDEELAQLAGAMHVAPELARTVRPTLGPMIAERDKRHYREQLDKVSKDPIYAGLVGTPEFENMTVRDRKGNLIKIGDLRAQLGDQVLDASGQPVAPKLKTPPTSGTESERAAELLGKIRETTDPVAKAKFQRQYDDILQAKKQLGQADDKSDPLLAELRAMRIEELKRRGNSPDMSPAQFNIANRLADDFARESKDYIQRAQSYGTVQAAVKDVSPAGDLSLIFAYMKMLDPSSVVREGEFATAQNTAGVPVRIRNAYNKIMTGERLAPEQRADFINQAKNVYGASKKRQDAIVETYTDRAKTANVPANMVVMDFGRGVDPATTPVSGGGAKAVKMRSPDGTTTAMVPADQVDAAKAKGATVVP